MVDRPSFFAGVLGRIDWIGLIGLGVVLVGGVLWAVDKELDSRIADLRVEFARADERAVASTASIIDALDDHRAEVQSMIEAGLAERTDEITRAIVSAGDKSQWFSVKVSNVPAASRTFEDLEAIAANFDSPAFIEFGGSAAFEFSVYKLSEPSAAALQAVLETTEGTGIQTSIAIYEGPSSMRAIPDIDAIMNGWRGMVAPPEPVQQ